MPSFRPTERHESWPMGFVHLPWRFPKAPWHHVGSFPGMALRPQDGLQSFHPCRFDGRKWRVSVTPSPVQTFYVSRSWPPTYSGIGSSWERSIDSGNHDAASCSWAIKITFTPGDWAIFCSTWGTILNGGNAYRRPLPLPQGMDMASVHSAPGPDTALRTWWVVCWRMSQTSQQYLRDHLEWREHVQEDPPVLPRHGHGMCPLCPGVRIQRYELDEQSVGESRKQVDLRLAPLGKHGS